MNVNHTPASRPATLAALKLKVHQYLASQIRDYGKDDSALTQERVRARAGEIYTRFITLLAKPSFSPAMVKGLCIRAKNAEGRYELAYGVYLHTCAIILGYHDWYDALRHQSPGKMIPNMNYQRFSDTPVAPIRESNVSGVKGLATLSKGSLVTWARLKQVLCNLSDQDMHQHIDSLLMEMQMAVGVTNPQDPRGDMLFAVFCDHTDEDAYVILGERYRPPNEVEGKYKTVMVKVTTYPLSNRILSISTPDGDSYSPFTIKQLVLHVRDQRKAVVEETTSWKVKK